MGPDDGGIWKLRPHTEPLKQCAEVEVPGVGVSSSYACEKWTSLRKFVEVLGVAEPVRIRNGHNPSAISVRKFVVMHVRNEARVV